MRDSRTRETFRELQRNSRKVTSISRCMQVGCGRGRYTRGEVDATEGSGCVQWAHYTWTEWGRKRVKATYNSYFEHLPRPIKFLQLASSYFRCQFLATKFCRMQGISVIVINKSDQRVLHAREERIIFLHVKLRSWICQLYTWGWLVSNIFHLVSRFEADRLQTCLISVLENYFDARTLVRQV